MIQKGESIFQHFRRLNKFMDNYIHFFIKRKDYNTILLNM